MTVDVREPHIGLIIEGKGDEIAIPTLLRLHLQAKGDFRDVLTKPIKTNGVTNATKPRGIEGYVATAASRPGCKGILIVLDADDECPADRAGKLKARIAGKTHRPFEIVLAVRDYEDWLYASIETLELSTDEYRPEAKGKTQIRAALKEKYVKPVWQPRLTARMDLNLAMPRSDSLCRLFARFDALLTEIP